MVADSPPPENDTTDGSSSSSDSEYNHIDPDTLSLSEAIDEVESIITDLQTGDVDLVTAENMYERGTELITYIKTCVRAPDGTVKREHDSGRDIDSESSALDDYM